MDENDKLGFAHKILNKARADHDLNVLWNHPLGDEFRDFYAEALLAFKEKRSGFVYALINPVMPDVHKIGFTRKAVPARVKSLNSSGLVAHLVPMHIVECCDAPAVEAQLHAKLKAVRVAKEFYQISWKDLVGLMDEVVHKDNSLFELQ